LAIDRLVAVLRAENIGASALHEVPPVDQQMSGMQPTTQSVFELPLGMRVTVDGIDEICGVIRQAHLHAASIRALPATKAG
jgi:hypothetical protein